MVESFSTCVCLSERVGVHTIPYLGSVGPSRTARPEERSEPALTIFEPDSCSLYWDHNTTGVGPRKKERKNNKREKSKESMKYVDS